MTEKYEVRTKPKEGKEYKISIWDNIESYEDYEGLFKTLNDITDKDTVVLEVMSSGGRCDIGYVIYNRIKELPCRVDVIVPYPTYSMGALLALSGHSLVIKPGAFLMFHDYSTGLSGKGNELLKQTGAYNEVFKYRFNNICQPFLSKKECEKVCEGKDLYITWKDTTLIKRLERHFSGCSKV